MNKSRRMAALQARALAAAGFDVLQMDLLGCGDSSGDFGDASWAAWVDDVVVAGQWLHRQCGSPPALWALRAGCLLATAAAAQIGTGRFIFWQPPVAGKPLVQQFLRLRMAAQLGGADGGKGVVEG
ncbi:MAG TPA: hydrolase 2, exosortase A system-associated, partial [Rubrivivax sp.]|nr:hydrolase 2, exosortase A system-associated [Rubrivivax sp.]